MRHRLEGRLVGGWWRSVLVLAVTIVAFGPGLAAAAAAAAESPVPDGAVVVEAGPITARIEPDPFRLTFVDADGATILADAPADSAALAGRARRCLAGARRRALLQPRPARRRDLLLAAARARRRGHDILQPDALRELRGGLPARSGHQRPGTRRT